MINKDRMISIRVNGQPMRVPQGTTIERLLQKLDVVQPPVAVERNAQICSHESLATSKIEDGDSFEVVSLTGGG